jgi:hypothetical protein
LPFWKFFKVRPLIDTSKRLVSFQHVEITTGDQSPSDKSVPNATLTQIRKRHHSVVSAQPPEEIGYCDAIGVQDLWLHCIHGAANG